jgi:hypothetical protein
MFSIFGPTLDLVGKQVRTWPTWSNSFEILGETIQDVPSMNTQTIKHKAFNFLESIKQILQNKCLLAQSNY